MPSEAAGVGVDGGGGEAEEEDAPSMTRRRRQGTVWKIAKNHEVFGIDL